MYVICLSRLEQYVYPNLDGTDHDHQVLYYTLLNSVAEDLVVNSLTPREHVKLLKKLKSVSLGKCWGPFTNIKSDLVTLLKMVYTMNMRL